jgi:hypothetical protein
MVACLGLLYPAASGAQKDLPTRVREAYSRLEQFTARGKMPIKITVAVHEVGDTHEIADKPYPDLVSLDTGYTTDLSVRRVHDQVAYDLEFRRENIDSKAVVGKRRVDTFTLAEVWAAALRLQEITGAEGFEIRDERWLEEQLLAPEVPAQEASAKSGPSPEDPPSVRFFQRYARYRVGIKAGEFRLDYEALALHVSTPGRLTLFVDPVLWMLDRMTLDERRLEALLTQQAAEEPDLLSGLAGSKVSGICDSYMVEYHPPGWTDGPNVGVFEHVSGSHSAFIEGAYACSCESNCQSTCFALADPQALEVGVTQSQLPSGGVLIHRTVEDTLESGSGHAEPGAGALCDVAGGACVVPCVLGAVCSVAVSYGGFEVQLPQFCMVGATLRRNGSCKSCTLSQLCPACTLPDGTPQECGRTVNCPLTRRNCGSCPLVGQVCDETVGSPTRGKCIIGCDGDNLCEPERGENCGNCLACRCPSGQSCNLFTQPPRCESNLPPPPVCGDGRCEGNENWSSCCFDCGCAGTGFPNDKVCQGLPPGQCVCTQPAIGNCGFAPNGCGELTYLGTCPSPQNCINNFCNGGGAPTCPNGICGPGENQSNCCRDCGCPLGFDCTGGGPGTCTGGGSCVPSDACTSGSTTLCAGTRWSNNCGRYVVCDITMCQPGQTCLFGACASPSGGGGNGGGNGDGGGGCECDPDGDGLVTEEECTQCCGGSIENNQCVA